MLWDQILKSVLFKTLRIALSFKSNLFVSKYFFVLIVFPFSIMTFMFNMKTFYSLNYWMLNCLTEPILIRCVCLYLVYLSFSVVIQTCYFIKNNYFIFKSHSFVNELRKQKEDPLDNASSTLQTLFEYVCTGEGVKSNKGLIFFMYFCVRGLYIILASLFVYKTGNNIILYMPHLGYMLFVYIFVLSFLGILCYFYFNYNYFIEEDKLLLLSNKIILVTLFISFFYIVYIFLINFFIYF